MQNLMSPYERVRRNAAGPILPKLETLLHCGTKRLAMSPPESTQLTQVCQLSAPFPISSAAKPHGCWVSFKK